MKICFISYRYTDFHKNGREQRIPSSEQGTKMDNNTHGAEIGPGSCLCRAVHFGINAGCAMR